MKKLDKQTLSQLLRLTTHVGALIPFAVMWWDYQNNQLGADPVRELTLRTGLSTLILLILSLACTPASTYLGWKQVIPLRRTLGLYAFLYVCLHFLIFVWLDYAWELKWIIPAVLEQRYVVVGFAAFLLLIPLAITSNQWSQRKLGKKWKTLHKTTYLVIILAALHFLWLGKDAFNAPARYAAIIALLLLLRVTPIKQRLLGWQRGFKRKSWTTLLVRQQARPEDR